MMGAHVIQIAAFHSYGRARNARPYIMSSKTLQMREEMIPCVQCMIFIS